MGRGAGDGMGVQCGHDLWQKGVKHSQAGRQAAARAAAAGLGDEHQQSLPWWAAAWLAAPIQWLRGSRLLVSKLDHQALGGANLPPVEGLDGGLGLRPGQGRGRGALPSSFAT